MKLQAKLLHTGNLTPREAEVFELICSGLSDKQIAAQLGIHIKTLSKHIDSVYEKMGLRWQSINTRCTAIGLAVASGMVKLVIRSVLLVAVIQTTMITDHSAVKTRARLVRHSTIRGLNA